MKQLPAIDPSSFTLSAGSHESIDEGACAMELVSYLAGEPWSDHPRCTCPAITAYAIGLNDRGPQWLRDVLRDLAPKMIGTRGSVSLQIARARLFAEAAIASAEDVLAIFEERRPGDDRPRAAIRAAREALDAPKAANAARAAAYAYAAAADAAYAADDADDAAAAANAARAAAYAADAADDARAAAYAAANAAAYAAYAAAADAHNHWRRHLGALAAAIALTEPAASGLEI